MMILQEDLPSFLLLHFFLYRQLKMSEDFLIKFTELSADFEEHAQASKEEEDNMPEVCNNLLNCPTRNSLTNEFEINFV